MVDTASPAAWASLSQGHVGLLPGCSQASGDLGTGLGCGSGSYGHHVRVCRSVCPSAALAPDLGQRQAV